MMASEEFNRMRAARKPGPLDRVVELQKPLGIVLEEDEKGNVYVKELSPAGNAARVCVFIIVAYFLDLIE